MRLFTAQNLKKLLRHIKELGFYFEAYGHTGVLSKGMAQLDLITYKNYSLMRVRKTA